MKNNPLMGLRWILWGVIFFFRRVSIKDLCKAMGPAVDDKLIFL